MEEEEMQGQLIYEEFLHHLGRMLLFRCDSFRETSEISRVMTTDPQGYITVNVPLLREFFREDFANMVEEYVDNGTPPAQPKLLELFHARSILARKNPIGRYYSERHSRRRARRQEQAFLLAVADCFPVCLGAVSKRIHAKMPESLRGSVSEESSPLLSAREVAKRVGVNDRTIRSWARQGKIRAKFKSDHRGRSRLVGIPPQVLAELLSARRLSPLARTA